MKLLLWIGLGILISGFISWAAYLHKSLSKSGVLGAMLLGTIIFGFGGWVWGAILVTFFLLSSLLSHYKTSVKIFLSEKFEKGQQRDLEQTLANGGAGALMALLFFFYPDPIVFAAFIGAMATVNADTWATELGVLAKKPPRLITTGKWVDPGTSGGISLPGTLAAFTGALGIGLAAVFFAVINSNPNSFRFLIPAVVGGLTGCIFDSFLGATAQVIYYSVKRKKETEKERDSDGTENVYLRGWHWLNNDWVNFLSSLAGMLCSALVWEIFY